MSPKKLLITRPSYETPTRYLFHWSKALIRLAKKKGFSVTDLSKGKAKRKKVEDNLLKANPDLVVFNGHGSESSVSGQGGEALIVAGENERLLVGKIVFARSCLSAKKLGKSCVEKGAKAYLGYKEDFVFLFDREKEKKPLQDQTAALFLVPSNRAIESLLEGQTSGEANKNGKDAFQENILALLTSETSREDSEAVRYLVWDRKHQVCVGDKKASI